MEVASPLSFVPNNTGTKRQFPCTQSFVDARNAFDSPDEFLQQKSFKRRRFNMDVSMDGDSENSVNHTTFPIHHSHPKSMFASDNGHAALKRSRTDVSTQQQDLQKVAEVQSAEIECLKHDKAHLESNLDSLKLENERVVHENKILKRAVTIQQERQNQASSEIEAARRFKFDAEDRIKRLEQVILSLRYHLQTQQSNPSFDLMGFPPRPPDVY